MSFLRVETTVALLSFSILKVCPVHVCFRLSFSILKAPTHPQPAWEKRDVELKLNRGKEGNGETCRRHGVNGALESSAGDRWRTARAARSCSRKEMRKEDECAECMVHGTVLKC